MFIIAPKINSFDFIFTFPIPSRTIKFIIDTALNKNATARIWVANAADKYLEPKKISIISEANEKITTKTGANKKKPKLYAEPSI